MKMFLKKYYTIIIISGMIIELDDGTTSDIFGKT